MKNGTILEKAETNLAALKENPYPGRGILVGIDEAKENFLQIYWIMGRSVGSRNRIFVDEGRGRLVTDLADQSKKPKDTSLIIYCAMAEHGGVYAVSNGHQTEDILKAVFLTHNHYEAIRKWDYEPDAPNFTPRISSIYVLPDHILDISIVKRSPFGGLGSYRQVYSPRNLFGGVGFCITTYLGDGDPLPSFSGEPYLLPILGTPKTAAETIWQHLNFENRVALAVKAINLISGKSVIEVINKY